MIETYIPTVSNVIKNFRRSVIERLLVALIYLIKKHLVTRTDKTALALY